MSIESIKDWFLGLGTEYGVNPIIFGTIYVGAIPFFTLSVAWLVKNARARQSVIVPAMLSGFFFISAYLYLIVAGKNVPWWVYAFVVLLLLFGGISTYKKVKSRINAHENEPA